MKTQEIEAQSVQVGMKIMDRVVDSRDPRVGALVVKTVISVKQLPDDLSGWTFINCIPDEPDWKGERGQGGPCKLNRSLVTILAD